MFNEAFQGPREDRYGYPGVNYPTANPRDLLIVEDYQQRTDPFHALGYGVPHDKNTACLLCWQMPTKGDGVEKNVRLYYANLRLAQETYNLVKGDNTAADSSFPTSIRSYLLPRGKYVKGTMGTALAALIGLILTNGGTGYGNNGQIPLIFTGGTGTGAAGYGEVVAGVIVSVFLTNSGSYTSPPIVSAAGGTGLAVTVLTQADQVLTDEVETPAEEPYGGYFVRVTRTWETLPGPELIKAGYESETGARMRTTRQPVLPGTPATDLGTSRTFDGITMYAVDSTLEEGDNVNKPTLVTVWMEIPATYTELSSEKSVCPAIFTYISDWLGPGDGFSNHGPFAGINFTQTAKRTAVAVETVISYTLGPSGVALPSLWTVISPGAASRFFPISGDTIHNAITFTEVTSTPASQLEEDLPPSTPTSYTIGDDMIIHASEKPWKYSVFSEKRISTASEPT